MTNLEKRAVFLISSIISLRMFGLFMAIPVFALFAAEMQDAEPFLIGLAMGSYGLTQALLQLPFGSLSDRLGRKPVIFFGLGLFTIGSLFAASAHSIYLLIFARALQGAGAVGATLLAMLSDLTSDEHRTTSMAIAGITIGLSFSLAMLAGPFLTAYMSVRGLFLIAGILGIAAIFILLRWVPDVTKPSWNREAQPELASFRQLFLQPTLWRLNYGIFILHAVFTASFMVIPIGLEKFAQTTLHHQWSIYVPALLPAFIISFAMIGYTEKRQNTKFYYLLNIFFMMIAEIMLLFLPQQIFSPTLLLAVFFTGFTTLEAFLPSLVSRAAPAAKKGSAMGLYSCAQFLGIFVGGMFGGLINAKFNHLGVYVFCLTLLLTWFLLSLHLIVPERLLNEALPVREVDWSKVADQLNNIPGIMEIVFIAEENTAYLKLKKAVLNHPDFLALRQELRKLATQSL